MSSSLQWDIGGLELIVESWDSNGCYLAIKTSSFFKKELLLFPRGLKMNFSLATSFTNNPLDYSPCFTCKQMKEGSSRGYMKGFPRILAKTFVKKLKKYWGLK